MKVECLNVGEEGTAIALQKAREKLAGGAAGVALDFSSVRRIDVSVLKAMEELAGLAETKNLKLVLRGVGVDVYKVLKLVKLAARFDFDS